MSSGLTKKVHKMNYNPALDKATKHGNNRSSRNHPFDADEMEERQMNEQWAAYQDSKAFADRVATLYGAGEDVRALQKARYGKLVERLEKRFGAQKGGLCFFSAPGRTFLCHAREGSWIMREAEQWDLPVVHIAEEEIVKLPDIHQFSLGFPDPQEAAEVASILNAKYGQDIHAYPTRGSVDITPPDVSKQSGIEQLKRVMGWQGAIVYAFGDEVNDLPMIEAYQGFTVDTARDVIKAKARASYPSVGAMLEAHL